MRLPSVSVSTSDRENHRENDRENRLNEGDCAPVANAELQKNLCRETSPELRPDPSPDPAPDPGRPDYWENYLGGTPALELPADRPRPAALGAVMVVESCAVREKLSEQLRRFSQETGIEVATAGLAAFSVLLHRYTAQDKFVIATGRGTGHVLPVVADFSDRPSFRELVNRLEAAICTGWTAGEIPADLAARLGIEADPSRHPIFQVAFSAGIGQSALAYPSVAVGTPAPGLDLDLEIASNGQLNLRLHYNPDLFEKSTAARMLNHMQELLAGAIADLNQSSAVLPMLTEEELHEQLVERNNTARNFPYRCLHELVELTAAKAPDQIAVLHGQQQLTYGEFNARANQLAHYLRKQGVGRNGRVGICLERSLDFAVALLGVLKAGATVVPLDPKYPSERLTYMLGDVAAPVVLTERGLLQAAIPEGTQVVCISQVRKLVAAEPRGNLSIGATPGASTPGGSTPSDIAYIIYTSGSTGRPRGVLLPHAGLANYTLGAAEMFDIRPGDRMLQFCSISFDAAIEEIFPTWAAGATLVFRRDDVSLEPSEFLDWATKQRISIMDLPTAYWHEWVYAMPGLERKVPAGLRLVIVGGEKASPEAFATWHRFAASRVRLINTYGPAEASVVATTYEPKLQPGEEPPAVLPIGRPVANARVYLLDPYLNPVPVGVPGELHIGGAGVAQGYLNLPALTEEKFVADIFSDDPLARMYKTGDLARYLPTGEIEFVGRRDHQVKIRGYRVEPGEIESVLAKHAGVESAAVVLREDPSGNKRLVGYVVANQNGSEQGTATDSELRQHVQKHLPEYMVPSEFVFLASLPLTPNGKVDRRALPLLQADSPAATTRTAVTSDPLEAELIAIWEELLGRRPIGLQDNFFDLGGHSLLAARLMQRVRQVLGKTLPLAALLQAPTIGQLAAVLRQDYSHHWSSLVGIQPEGSKPPFFMVHGVGGNVVGFVELGRHMKPDYPFYGLQSQGLDGKNPLHTRIEDMAAHYLEEIRTVQPRGPYHLGGFSFGGLVAYEMARQLLSRGEDVGALVLFDTYATNPKPVKLLDLARNPGQINFGQLPDELRRKIRRTILMWRLPEDLKKVMRTNAQAAEKYTLQPYSGQAFLLRAEDGWRATDDAYAAWGRLVGSLETIAIGGAHMDILREPQVSHLAECLKDCIDGTAATELKFLAELPAEMPSEMPSEMQVEQ